MALIIHYHQYIYDNFYEIVQNMMTQSPINNWQEERMMSLNCQGANDVLLSGERQNSLSFAILNTTVKRFEQGAGTVYVRRNKRKKYRFFFFVMCQT